MCGPQQCSVEFVSSPDKFERVRDTFAQIKAIRRRHQLMDGISIGSQELDDEAQLASWLSS
ncbi:hypothetical protein FRC09_004494, partial [Ceratobasidium sp. 395]